MNKTELVAAIADKAEISKKDSEKALKAFVDVVTEELKKGHKIQLVGFGTFETSERAARVPPFPSRISGGGGTSLCRPGSATMSTSRSAAIGSKNPAGSGIFWSSGR